MRFFHHHVAKTGISDLHKTVFKQVHVSLLEDVNDTHVKQVLLPQIRELFPTGYFNCWGVPDGAGKIIRGKKHLQSADCVLLVTSPNLPNSMPVLCDVKLFDATPVPPLSQALWGDQGFPFIFFFDTERLSLDWQTFKKDVGYDDRYRPQGRFEPIGDNTLIAIGGPNAYLQMLRKQYAISMNSFRDVTPDELDAEGLQHSDATVASEIDEEINAIESVSTLKADDPPLTQPINTNDQKRITRDYAFSIIIKRAYSNRCAICGTGAIGRKGQSELHAAHIYPKSKKGSDLIQNGILLCLRHHWAFDVGWISFSDVYRISVHPDIPKASDYHFINMFDGKFLSVPSNPSERPHPKYLEASRGLNNKMKP